MKYLLVIFEGNANHQASKTPNIDTLAANGRLGMLEGWKGVGSLMPREAAKNDSATFTCGVASLDEERNAGDFVSGKDELGKVAEAISSIDIDGVKFSAEASELDIILKAEGDGLSSRIVPNLCAPDMPLAQVCAAAGTAKKTASVLNKLTYRVEKRFPGKALFVKKAGRPQAGFPSLIFGLRAAKAESPIDAMAALECHDIVFLNSGSAEDVDRLAGAIKNTEDIITIIIWHRGDLCTVPALIHGGGILPGHGKKFSEAACSRGFMIEAEDLLSWVIKAAGNF